MARPRKRRIRPPSTPITVGILTPASGSSVGASAAAGAGLASAAGEGDGLGEGLGDGDGEGDGLGDGLGEGDGLGLGAGPPAAETVKVEVEHAVIGSAAGTKAGTVGAIGWRLSWYSRQAVNIAIAAKTIVATTIRVVFVSTFLVNPKLSFIIYLQPKSGLWTIASNLNVPAEGTLKLYTNSPAALFVVVSFQLPPLILNRALLMPPGSFVVPATVKVSVSPGSTSSSKLSAVKSVLPLKALTLRHCEEKVGPPVGAAAVTGFDSSALVSQEPLNA